MQAHPFGVQPLGNCYASCGAAGVAAAVRRGASGDPVRADGLGALGALPDELLLALLGALAPRELAALCCVSRAARAFASHDELWRAATLARYGGDFRFTRTWRETYRLRQLGAEGDADGDEAALRAPASERVRAPGLCSDVLFQAHLCAATPLHARWLERETVARAAGLTQQQFAEQYERPGEPVILTDVVPAWPAYAAWDTGALEAAHGGRTVFAGGYAFTLRDYLRYARAVTRDDAPLYLFDREVLGATSLGSEYSAPAQVSGDYFSVLGARRPDYRWLIAGPARSGSTWHVDPNGTSAWNGVVRGSKKWLLCPPGAPPPGVAASADGCHVTCPLALTEWLLSFYDAAAVLPRARAPRECICRAGELLFIPAGWWHMALNLDFSVAVTQNFVSDANLPAVLRLLATRSDALLSGCAPGERGALGARFEEAMGQQHPEVLRAARAAMAAEDAAAEAARRHEEGARTFTFNFAPPEEAEGD